MHHGLQKLHERRDDEDEHHGLQIIEIQRDKYIRIHRPRDRRRDNHDNRYGAAHAERRIELFGNAEERTDAEKLIENIVLREDCGKENAD